MESIKIGINGFGRIGRLALRASLNYPGLEIAGINTRGDDIAHVAYLTKYDTVHGTWDADVQAGPDCLIVNGRRIAFHSTSVPEEIPWKAMGVEYVLECTGAFASTEAANAHIKAGAKKVVLSAPAKDDSTPTFVTGVNSDLYTKDMAVVSAASCTTNCLAPLAKVIHEAFGIREGLMTTCHAVTASQETVDGTAKKDWRGGRAASGNIIPASTGAAKAVGLVIPSLKGKLTGMSLRVPVLDGSVVDLTVNLEKPTTYDEICAAIKQAADGPMKGVIEITNDLLVSSDIIGHECSCVVDAKAGIMLSPTFVKLMAWYDNEWGYTCGMLKLLQHMAEVDRA